MTEYDYWYGTIDGNKVSQGSELRVEDFTVRVADTYDVGAREVSLPFDTDRIYEVDVIRTRHENQRRSRHPNEEATIEFHTETGIAIVKTDDPFPTQYALTTLNERLDWVAFDREVCPSPKVTWGFVDEASAVLELFVEHEGNEYPYDAVPKLETDDVVGIKHVTRGRLQFDTDLGHITVEIPREGCLSFDATRSEQAEVVLRQYEAALSNEIASSLDPS